MSALPHLRRIEAFLAVAEARNMSHAAMQLDVAQSVVSRHVAALEAELGCRLFERTGRGVGLTPAAEALAPRLRASLAAMQQATAEIAEAGNQPVGTVRVGVVPASARPLVGRLYRHVAERWPRVRLQFDESFSTALEERLSNGELDIAVMNRFGRAAYRGEERLCVVESLLVGPAGAFARAGRTAAARRTVEAGGRDSAEARARAAAPTRIVRRGDGRAQAQAQAQARTRTQAQAQDAAEPALPAPRASLPEVGWPELATLPFVLASRPNALRVALDEVCRRAGVQVQVMVEADSMAAMKDLVAQNRLYTILPAQLVADELSAGRLGVARLADPGLPRTLSLATSSRHAPSAATRAVAHAIRTIVVDELAGSIWR